jgi:hypothetical protein
LLTSTNPRAAQQSADVFSFSFSFFVFSPKPVWVALCVDGQEDGQACLESALPPGIATDAYDAFMRGYCFLFL